VFVRIAAGLTGLAVLIPVLVWGGWPGVDAVCAIAALVGLHEYGRMAFSEHGLARRAVVMVGGALCFGGLLYGGLAWVGALCVGALLGAFLVEMAVARSLDGAADRVGRMFMGMAYIGLLLPWVALVRRLDQGVALIFLLLAATWLGDTGAFFSGKALGRHKMAPLLSPNKTWEGMLGGLLASMLGALAVGLIAGVDLPWYLLMALGGLVDIAGVLGDLAESLMKRTWGVKDSGSIMPGHGGILDRIDSVLFSAPVLYLALYLIEMIQGTA